jgi:RNA polymerase-associated protein
MSTGGDHLSLELLSMNAERNFDGLAIPAARKPIMTLYAGASDPFSHRTRIVLFEKDVECHIVEVDVTKKPRELADLNPYNQVPTMVDRDLVLYEANIISEYLDERLPHPPLMPVDPVSRARARLMLLRFDRDWYSLLPDITGGDKKTAQRARAVIRDGLSVISPIFKEQSFVLGEELSLVDCALAPLLWRLDHYDIELPKQARSIVDYAERLFARKAFKLSLTEPEKEMRKG